MRRFSPNTVIQVVKAFRFNTHSQLEQLALEFGFSDALGDGGIEKRETHLMQHLVAHPELTGPRGGPLVVELVERVVEQRCATSYGEARDPVQVIPELVYALRQDGFTVVDLQLRSMLPEAVPVAAARDEVGRLLEKHGFSTAKGHLDQALAAHARGDWAAANGQLRSFFEHLLDRIASALSGGVTDTYPTSHQRREWLATAPDPFFYAELNEWEPGRQGGFVQGLWKRLHSGGAHPGLSDETEATFRLHVVLIAAEHYLRRFDARVGV